MLRIYCLNVSHVYTYAANGVCVHDETGSAGCEFPHKIHTQWWGYSPLCVCAYMCENVHSFVYSFKISIFSPRIYIFIDVLCVVE